MTLRIWFGVGVLAAVGIAGCGGAASVAPTKAASSRYVEDPVVNRYPSLSFSYTGVSTAGEWLGIVNSDNTLGYLVNGTFTQFPKIGVVLPFTPGPVGAGGNYVWATYAVPVPPTQSESWTAILDRSTGNLASNYIGYGGLSCIVAPNGQTAFVVIDEIPPTTPAVRYGLLNASGLLHDMTNKIGSRTIYPIAVSNAGYVAGFVSADWGAPSPIETAKRARVLRQENSIVVNMGSDIGGVLRPDGSRVLLQGKSPYPLAVDDQGNTCGCDILPGTHKQVAARWDANGNETLMEVYDSANAEYARAMSPDGYLVGATDTGPTGSYKGLIWDPKGKVSLFAPKSVLAGTKLTILEGFAIQSKDKVLVRASEPGKANVVMGLITSK